MPKSSRSVALIVAGFVTVAAWVSACSDEASSMLENDPDPFDASQEGGGPPREDGGDRDAGSKDSAPNDAGRDARVDAEAGSDAGIEPGDPCTTVGEIYERHCGKCGMQKASCSPSKVVTGFGACTEPGDACTPGTTETGAACGYCGTTSRTCNTQCKWDEQACQGEVTTPDRCKAGETVDRDQGCAPGVTRPWTCSTTCAWLPPTITCEEANGILIVGGALGAKVTRTFKLRDEVILRLVDSASTPCKLSPPPFNTMSRYVYAEVRNPNADAVKVDIAISKELTTQPDMSLLVAGYSALPTTEVERKACLSGARLGTVYNAELTFLTGIAPSVVYGAIRIPANGSAWIYVGNFSASDPAVKFKLSATIAQMPAL